MFIIIQKLKNKFKIVTSIIIMTAFFLSLGCSNNDPVNIPTPANIPTLVPTLYHFPCCLVSNCSNKTMSDQISIYSRLNFF